MLVHTKSGGGGNYNPTKNGQFTRTLFVSAPIRFRSTKKTFSLISLTLCHAPPKSSTFLLSRRRVFVCGKLGYFLYIQLSTSICSVSQRERDIKVNIVVYMKSGLYEQQNLYHIDFLNLLIVIFSKFNSQQVL